MKKGMKLPEGWKKVELGECFSRLVRKNDEGNTNVLTISAQHGLISQEKFFNKSIASEDKSNYFLLEKGDFAYNKSYSAGYPFGAIKSLEKYEKGIVSPLYICFKKTADNKCPEYFLHYFEAGLANNEICAVAQEGARNHGLLNISTDDFFKIKILLPPLPEQQKIAEILATQDKIIELKEKLLEQKQTQKKWLMQKLLSNDGTTFTLGGVRIDKSGWEKEKLGKVIGYAFSSQSFKQKGVPVVRISNIDDGLVSLNDVVYSDEINLPCQFQLKYGDLVIAMSGATTGKIGVYKGKEIAYINQRIGKFALISKELYYYYLIQFCKSFVFLNQLELLLTAGAQPNIGSFDIENMYILLPPLPEQQAIAEVLSTADKEIDLLKSDIEQEKQKKKALMQLLLTGIVRVKL